VSALIQTANENKCYRPPTTIVNNFIYTYLHGYTTFETSVISRLWFLLYRWLPIVYNFRKSIILVISTIMTKWARHWCK